MSDTEERLLKAERDLRTIIHVAERAIEELKHVKPSEVEYNG